MGFYSRANKIGFSRIIAVVFEYPITVAHLNHITNNPTLFLLGLDGLIAKYRLHTTRSANN